MNFLNILSVTFLLYNSLNIGDAKALPNLKNNKKVGDANGGRDCAYCTIVVGMSEQLAIVYNQTVEASLDQLCSFLPQGMFRTACTDAVNEFGPVIING